MDPFTDSMSDLDTLDLRLEYVAAMLKGVSHEEAYKISGGRRGDALCGPWGHFGGQNAC